MLIGNFDGLHLGHQKLFSLAKKYKKRSKLNIGVITFEPMPKMYFNKNLKNFRISNVSQKIKILEKLGIDFIIIKKFDKKFSKIKSHSFIKYILQNRLNAKYIFVSNNFRFGNKREGNVTQLIQYEKKYKYKIIKPKPFKKKNKVISSTFVRKLLSNGKIEAANKLLEMWGDQLKDGYRHKKKTKEHKEYEITFSEKIVKFTKNLKNSAQISIFYGSQKGGLICANGTCVPQPDFQDGIKLTFRKNF